MPVLKEAELRQTVAEIFAPLGSTDEEVARLQDHLVGANLRGHDSHGVRMCPTYVELWRKGDIVFGAELETLRESPAHAVLDAHTGLGQRMAWHAAQLAIEKGQRRRPRRRHLAQLQPHRPPRRIRRADRGGRPHRLRHGQRSGRRAAGRPLGRGGAAPFGQPLRLGHSRAGTRHHGRHLADCRGRRQGQRQAAARRALACPAG